MALGSNPWMLEQLERYNREIGPAQRIQVAPEPQPDQAALFAKFQSTVANWRTTGKISIWDQGTWDIPLHPGMSPTSTSESSCGPRR